MCALFINSPFFLLEYQNKNAIIVFIDLCPLVPTLVCNQWIIVLVLFSFSALMYYFLVYQKYTVLGLISISRGKKPIYIALESLGAFGGKKLGSWVAAMN